MRTFYRIETLDMDEGGIPVCGYMAIVDTLLCMKLGIKPDHTAEELQKALKDKSDDEDVKTIWKCLALLSDIPIPDIYKDNQSEMYCLYSKDEYKEAAGILSMLWGVLIDTLPQYSFYYKKFKLKYDEILDEDMYQVVISKEVYEKHINDSKYRLLD